MQIDLEPIKRKYPDINWRIEPMLQNGKIIRCFVGSKGKLYKAFLIPPHEYYTLKGRHWPTAAASVIARLIHEGEK